MALTRLNNRALSSDSQFTADQLDVGQLGGRRNHVINGNFDVWQRGTSSGSVGYHTADRWYLNTSGGIATASQGVFTNSQTDVPYNPKYYMHLDVTQGDNYCGWQYRMEHKHLYANQDVTISFWAKSTSPKQLSVRLQATDGTYDANSEVVFTTNTSWTKHEYVLNVGSTSHLTAPAEGYTRFSIGQTGADTSTTPWDLDLAQVQLEFGSLATPFEHRSYGEELALCQRYYERCGSGIVGGTSSNMSAWNSGVTFKVEKRVPPSVTHLSNFNAITPGSNQHTVSVSTLHSYTTWGACLTHTASGSAASNQCWLYYESSNNIAFDAEL